MDYEEIALDGFSPFERNDLYYATKTRFIKWFKTVDEGLRCPINVEILQQDWELYCRTFIEDIPTCHVCKERPIDVRSRRDINGLHWCLECEAEFDAHEPRLK